LGTSSDGLDKTLAGDIRNVKVWLGLAAVRSTAALLGPIPTNNVETATGRAIRARCGVCVGRSVGEQPIGTVGAAGETPE